MTAEEEVREALARGLDRPPVELFGSLTDDAWFWANTEGRRTIPELASLLPGSPSEEMQMGFTGSCGDEGLRAAFHAYTMFLELYRAHATPGSRLTRVLDFGCGWGRIIRFFLREITPAHLWGCDISESALDELVAANRWCSVVRNEPSPPIALPSESFDLIYSYSVLSHLPESTHRSWLPEFRRLLRPGGVVIATTFRRSYIELCGELRSAGTITGAPGVRAAVDSFVDTDSWLAAYDRGEFCFSGRPGIVHFGDACVPEGYVRRIWPEWLEVCAYLDDPAVNSQNVIIGRARLKSAVAQD
jgi:SAM-dependent methyltransferase